MNTIELSAHIASSLGILYQMNPKFLILMGLGLPAKMALSTAIHKLEDIIQGRTTLDGL